MKPRCPTCRRELAPRSAPALETGPAPGGPSPHPFCSPRCKLIDLGNWLDGSYRIPVSGGLSEDDVEELASALVDLERLPS